MTLIKSPSISWPFEDDPLFHKWNTVRKGHLASYCPFFPDSLLRVVCRISHHRYCSSNTRPPPPFLSQQIFFCSFLSSIFHLVSPCVIESIGVCTDSRNLIYWHRLNINSCIHKRFPPFYLLDWNLRRIFFLYRN